MELEVSRGTVCAFAAAVLLTLLALLGRAVTPVDADCQPLVLSPDYVATLRYLKAAQGCLDRLTQIDADLARVMEEKGNIYTQGRDAERAFEMALSVAREVEQSRTPPSLASLRTALALSATGYVQAARGVLLYVGAPSRENRQALDEALGSARTNLEACQSAREELWPAR